MIVIPTWLVVLTLATAAVMFALGIGVFVRRDLTMKLSGHTLEGGPAILGARSLILGALGLSFLYLKNIEALTVLLGLGMIFTLFDAVVEYKHGASMIPHVVFLIPVTILFYSFYNIYTTGAA